MSPPRRTGRTRPIALALSAVVLAITVTSEPAGADRAARLVALSETEIQTVALAARQREASQRTQASLQAQQRHQAQQARRIHALAAAKARAQRRAANAQAAARALAAQQAPAADRTARATAGVRRTESAVQRGQRVLASLHYGWQTLGYRFEFLPSRAGYLGLTIPRQKLVQIYVRGSQSDLVLAHSIAHELGHVLDLTRGSGAKRAQYLSIRTLSQRLTWYGCSGCTDYQTPAGDWAEVFAYWLAGPGDFRSQLAAAPASGQLAALGPLFRL
ncbi:MAG: hypothetical protein JWM02_960 [Frankiales bacterium]|nr:hypothetical protein [Frankiales bacterium]